MLAADSASRAFNEVRREADLDDGLDFHSLRRSYVTHLVEDGYDAFFIQQQVGHEHASTTSSYTGLSPDYRARVVDDAITRWPPSSPEGDLTYATSNRPRLAAEGSHGRPRQ